MARNDRSRAVLDGNIKPEGIELVGTACHASELFWRQLTYAEFDVSEMSMSSLLIYLSKGNTDWVALPIFTTRQFFHTGVLVTAASGIEKPEDLKGKRVGVPEYQQTAALWSRGALMHEWGVSPKDIHWFMERTEALSHGGPTGFTPPEGVKLDRIPQDKSIGSMLLSGELDATLLYLTDNNLVDRSREDISTSTKIRRLFPDGIAEGQRYYKKTGLFPINHGMIVRRSIYEKDPWVALNLLNAFRLAKEGWLARVKEQTEAFWRLGLISAEDNKALTTDPFPYGVKSNQHTLETIAQYSNEQGLTPRVLKMEEIFAPSTLEL